MLSLSQTEKKNSIKSLIMFDSQSLTPIIPPNIHAMNLSQVFDDKQNELKRTGFKHFVCKFQVLTQNTQSYYSTSRKGSANEGSEDRMWLNSNENKEETKFYFCISVSVHFERFWSSCSLIASKKSIVFKYMPSFTFFSP